MAIFISSGGVTPEIKYKTGRKVSYFCPTFQDLSYFFLLLGKIPTFSYFFRFSLELIDENAIFGPKNFLAPLHSA